MVMVNNLLIKFLEMSLSARELAPATVPPMAKFSVRESKGQRA